MASDGRASLLSTHGVGGVSVQFSLERAKPLRAQQVLYFKLETVDYLVKAVDFSVIDDIVQVDDAESFGAARHKENNLSSDLTGIPWWTPEFGIPALRDHFQNHGLVLLKGFRKSQHFSETLGTLGQVYLHPHASPDGLTHLISESNPTEPTRAADSNLLGMTESALTPHTDRSGIDDPPQLLGFWIESQSSVGGASTFVDGHRLIEELSAHDPDSIRVLTRPRSVIFKSENGLMEGQILYLDGKKFTLRFRFDRMVYFAPDVAALVPRLHTLIRDQAIRARLAAGEGYLLDNHRWLHGRTHFSGKRSCYRILLRSEEQRAR